MNELSTVKIQLPEPIDELVKFALVGRDKLAHVKAEIAAIDKIGLAKDVKDQKLKEAQAISEMVLDAEVRIGELMKDVPKASGGDRRSENFKSNHGETFEKQKTKVIKEAGLTKVQVSKFQTLANHPEIVKRAKEKARENGDILSRASVLKEIANSKQKKSDPVKQAEKEHERYNLNKSAGVVDIQEAKKDKDNRVILETAFISDVLKLINQVQDFSRKYDGMGYTVLRNILTEEYKDDSRDIIILQLEECKRVFVGMQTALQKGE